MVTKALKFMAQKFYILEKSWAHSLSRNVSHGEGSRGGRIIGHTSSGKPVYALGNKKQERNGWKKKDHWDAAVLHSNEAAKHAGHSEAFKHHNDLDKKHTDLATTDERVNKGIQCR